MPGERGSSPRRRQKRTPSAIQALPLAQRLPTVVTHLEITPEGTKLWRATSVNAQLPCLQKDLCAGSISRDIVNFPSELSRRRSGTFAEVERLVPPGHTSHLLASRDVSTYCRRHDSLNKNIPAIDKDKRRPIKKRDIPAITATRNPTAIRQCGDEISQPCTTMLLPSFIPSVSNTHTRHRSFWDLQDPPGTQVPLAGQASWPAPPTDTKATRGLHGLRSEENKHMYIYEYITIHTYMYIYIYIYIVPAWNRNLCIYIYIYTHTIYVCI